MSFGTGTRAAPAARRHRTAAAEDGDAQTGDLMSIGEAAKRSGTSTRALRYYEETGLVMPAAHSQGGHRLYGPAQLARVARIRELQDLMGFNLAEIGALLANEDRLDSLREAFNRDEDPARRSSLAREAIAVLEELDARVAAKHRRLGAFRRSIAERRERAEAIVSELDRGSR